MKTLNAVFIQPTYSCALNCQGCYVKESTKHEQMNTEQLKSMLRYIWVNPNYFIKQITIAVDDIPHDNTEAKNTMVEALRTSLRLKKLFPSGPELHITCNSLGTLRQYSDAGISITDLLSSLDLLSVSHLTQRDKQELAWIRLFTEVNYNYMPQGDIDKYIDMLNHVDMSYLILHKTGLGNRNEEENIKAYKRSLRRIAQIDNDNLRRKVIIDTCVSDANKYRNNGFGCNANISKLHIWPDGHVTGCPYNEYGGQPAYLCTDLVRNIESALRRYEFRQCTISDDYFGNRRKVQRGNTQDRRSRHLQVL